MFVGEMFFPFASFARAEGRGLFRVDGCFEGIQDQLSGGGKRDAGEEMVHDAGQCRGAVVDQILEMNCQHFGLIEPTEVGGEASSDFEEIRLSRHLVVPKMLTLRRESKSGRD